MQALRRGVRAGRRRAPERVQPPVLRAVRRDVGGEAREVMPDVQEGLRRVALRREDPGRERRGRGRAMGTTLLPTAAADGREETGEVGEGAGVRPAAHVQRPGGG